ncbi:MAG TPA: MBL fold metallo-hydrolase [Ktedonobacteraceae bacterium]|nr:MBL fold metallo-hydrolase [Ktedonobacteraceae bacterium]
MEISWLGHSCFMLRGKNVTLITDPFSPVGATLEVARPSQVEPLKLGKLNAPIVTISHNHPGHNFAEGIGGNPRVVRGPGEYEISDVLITGVPSYHDDKRGAERGRNTIYVIHMDDLVICHLGDLGHSLQEEQLEEVADADILLIPISGQNTLSAAQAAEVISQVEPHVVIPMHYRPLDNITPHPLDKFCREMGIEAINEQPKLTINRSTLPVETQVVILSQRA